MTSKQDILSQLYKQPVSYTDFFNDLDTNPFTGDLAILKNENSVKNSIKNLILTDITERPYNYGLGSGIRKLLFDPIDNNTAALIQSIIINTVRNYEPRVDTLNVTVIANSSSYSYNVIIEFNLKNSNSQTTQLSIILNRIR